MIRLGRPGRSYCPCMLRALLWSPLARLRLRWCCHQQLPALTQTVSPEPGPRPTSRTRDPQWMPLLRTDLCAEYLSRTDCIRPAYWNTGCLILSVRPRPDGLMLRLLIRSRQTVHCTDHQHNKKILFFGVELFYEMQLNTTKLNDLSTIL